MTRLDGDSGDREVQLNGETYTLSSDENTKTFSNIQLVASTAESDPYELRVPVPVAWSLVNKKNKLYKLKSLYTATFRTQDDTNVFTNKNTVTPEETCPPNSTKFYVQMSDSGKNHWDSNDDTLLVIRNSDGTLVFSDAYTSNFEGFDSIKEVYYLMVQLFYIMVLHNTMILKFHGVYLVVTTYQLLTVY